MQRLIDQGVMKTWVQNGIPMCSYRTIIVGEDRKNERTVELQRVSFLFLSQLCFFII